MTDPGELRTLLKGDLEWETIGWGEEYQSARFHDEDGQLIEYRNWSPETSRVVSGPIGPESKSRFPGRRFRDRNAARLYWTARGGEIIEEYPIPGRYIFRIKRRQK